ncbi:MAG: metallophosphoesterase [Dehalococcoidia bacterium]
MLIGLLGDVHGRVLDAFRAIVALQHRIARRFDLVIQVGDMGAFPDMAQADGATFIHSALDPSEGDFARLLNPGAAESTEFRSLRRQLVAPIYFLRGNHEDFAWLDALPVDGTGTAAVDAYDLLRYVPDDTVIGLATLRIAFLGGVEEGRGADVISRAAYERLLSSTPGSLDLLITHQGPYGSSTGFRGDVQGSMLITALVDQIAPRWHVAGHAHTLVGPALHSGTVCLLLSALVPSRRWAPEARGLMQGCMAILDTDRGELSPVTGDWLSTFKTRHDAARAST